MKDLRSLKALIHTTWFLAVLAAGNYSPHSAPHAEDCRVTSLRRKCPSPRTIVGP